VPEIGEVQITGGMVRLISSSTGDERNGSRINSVGNRFLICSYARSPYCPSLTIPIFATISIIWGHAILIIFEVIPIYSDIEKYLL
jgi:hypothetical protein